MPFTPSKNPRIPPEGTNLYTGFRLQAHIKNHKARGIAKPRVQNLSIKVPWKIYQQMSCFKDYRHLTWPGIIVGLWERYMKELDQAGHWPPDLVSREDLDFDETIVKAQLSRDIAKAEAEKAARRF